MCREVLLNRGRRSSACGWCPCYLILNRPAADKLDGMLWTPSELAQVGELDEAEVLVRLGGGRRCPVEPEQQELLAEWPDEPHREDAFRVPVRPAGSQTHIRRAGTHRGRRYLGIS